MVMIENALLAALDEADFRFGGSAYPSDGIINIAYVISAFLSKVPIVLNVGTVLAEVNAIKDN